MTRFRAAGIHLMISALVVGLVLLTMLGLWYPGAYFKLMGGGGLLFILAGVDICVGPLLTFIVFKGGKKNLAFDLTAIALLQSIAMAYGASVMFQARPAFTVFSMGTFHVATATNLDVKDLARASRPEWKRAPLGGPVVVAAALPTDDLLRIKLILGDLMKSDMYQLPSLYVPYADVRPEVLRAAKPLSDLRAVHAANGSIIDQFLLGEKAQAEQFAYVPVQGRNMEMTAIVDAQNGDFKTILAAQPR